MATQTVDVVTQLMKQHDEILALVATFTPLLNEVGNASNAAKARQFLDKLASLLGSHLMVEDKLLYPALIKSTNAKVRDTATLFAEQMGHLLADVQSYLEKWTTSIHIAADAKEFAKETNVLVALLLKRIERENTELFPLLS